MCIFINVRIYLTATSCDNVGGGSKVEVLTYKFLLSVTYCHQITS